MFGFNPYPVTNMLASQANTYGNSFTDPMNYANMNNGWGIDPSLLTPSYQANYRPQYQGSQPSNEYGRMGFFGGLARLSPTSRDLSWGNPIMHQQQAIEDVSGRPADAGMWGFQRIGAPIAAFAAGRAATSALGLGWGAGSRFGAGLGGGIASGFGANAPAGMGIRSAWSGIRGGYSAGGAGGAFGAARGIGAGGALNLAARGVGGTIFGAAAAVGVPLAIGQGIMYGAEKFITDPYINTRMSARSMRDNFAGVTFGDSQGNAVSGRGLGFKESYGLAQNITGQGIDDMTFGTSQYAQGADMLGRAGLMDNVSAGGISKRVKDSMAQVKLIMSIAAMPEMKDAIEQLAKLQMAGASVSGGISSTAAGAMGGLGRYASVAGTSVQRMMSTVGAQGQYLYQANGMTPYLGQMAAAAAYSSLAAGNRMGLISPEQLARMGGLEGATQGSLTGQINASQTMFNKMSNYNAFTNGRGGYGSSMLGTVQQFGQNMSSDPLGTYGGLMIHGRQMAGKQMEARGSLSVEDQLMSIAKNVPGAVDVRTGKIRAEKAVPFLMQMGMDMDQIQAFYAQRISEGDQGTYNQSMRGMDSQLAEQQRQYISQTGTYGGLVGSSIYNLRKAGRSLTRGISGAIVNPITNAIGGAGDALQGATDSLWFGSTLTNSKGSGDIDELLGGKPARTQRNLSSVSLFEDAWKQARAGDQTKGGTLLKYGRVGESINELARKGNSAALDYLQSANPTEKKKKLRELIKSGALGKDAIEDYATFESSGELENFLSTAQRTAGQDLSAPTREPIFGPLGEPLGYRDVDNGGGDKSGEFNGQLERISGVKGRGKAETLQAAGLAASIAGRGDINPDNIDDLMKTDTDLQKYAKLTGVSDGGELMKLARKSTVNSAELGTVGLATVANSLNSKNYSNQDDLIRDAAKINGGVYKNGMSNAKDITTDEAIGSTINLQQDAKQRSQAYQRLKEGRIDFSGYQQTVNALDNKKAVDTFANSVQTFKQAVEGMSGSKVKDSSGMPSYGFLSPSAYGTENKNVAK